ncbi:tRNA(m5U54)methyltransferase [Myxozyma melibiosi]|uniref:tRNA(M5U54)methyltransferase n=1 Tax=Myxozyma melibiosi TaxID=54550 RepID=A0ABR1F3M8_9ASCO
MQRTIFFAGNLKQVRSAAYWLTCSPTARTTGAARTLRLCEFHCSATQFKQIPPKRPKAGFDEISSFLAENTSVFKKNPELHRKALNMSLVVPIVTAPAGKNESTPAGENESTPAGEIESTPAGENEYTPAGENESTQVDGAATDLKRPNPETREKIPQPFRKKTRKEKMKKTLVTVEPMSTEGYLLLDILDLRRQHGLPVELKTKDTKKGAKYKLAHVTKVVPAREEDINIVVLSSTGDGLGLLYAEDGSVENVVVVPYSIPGDVVRAKLYQYHQFHIQADLISIVSSGPERDDSLIRCKYFSMCGGCQLQMMPYEAQLEHKRTVIKRAYEHFCPDAPAGAIPEIGSTISSPLEYGYRTKLTPHFDIPRHGHVPEPLPIGFTQKGRSHVVDIEECPLTTPAINEAYGKARDVIKDKKHLFKRGVTLMYRESVKENSETNERETEVITDFNATVTEYVNDFRFKYTARDFFQCNSSVLPKVTEYVREQLRRAVPPLEDGSPAPPLKYLVDAYCGSGLFGITCSKDIDEVIGVEVSKMSVECAMLNAADNNVNNATFVEGDAAVIFGKIRTPANQTTMILDPSRKGCDERFLNQLLDYQPRRVVYVSCNVHTQARDVEYILKSEKGAHYVVDSLRGFDFFPQTHHVESVAVLTRVGSY